MDLELKQLINIDNDILNTTLNVEITSRKEWLSFFKCKIPQNKEKILRNLIKCYIIKKFELN